MRSKDRLMIGWKEYIEFPEWKISQLKAKIDTGAKTSSLDVYNIELLPGGRVKFNVVLVKKARKHKVSVIARVSRVAKVKSSPIHHEDRIFVKTKMRLGSVEKDMELNLVDRSNLAYRMIIGRTAIKGDFVVDVARSYLLSKKKRKAKGTRQ